MLYVGWFSMSPLPRLHHHHITIIFFILTIVELLHHARTKSFCHILTHTQKRREKSHSLALALAVTLIVNIRLDHSTTRHC